MLGNLGGVTAVTIVLCRNEIKPAAIAVWALYLVVAAVWTAATGALAGGVPL